MKGQRVHRHRPVSNALEEMREYDCNQSGDRGHDNGWRKLLVKRECEKGVRERW